MNLEQLENLRRLIRSMRLEIKKDNAGSSEISNSLTELEKKIDDKLREAIWQRYLEEVSE